MQHLSTEVLASGNIRDMRSAGIESGRNYCEVESLLYDLTTTLRADVPSGRAIRTRLEGQDTRAQP
jgi:hypothetical protein